MPKAPAFTSTDFSRSKLTLVQLLSEQLIAGGVESVPAHTGSLRRNKPSSIAASLCRSQPTIA